MRESTQQEWNAAKRAVARIARQVREATGNPYIKGSVDFALPDEDLTGFTLKCAPYDIAEVSEAVRALELTPRPCSDGVSVNDLKVEYPKGGE